MITLLTRPLSLSLSAFIFGLRTLLLVVNTWVELAVVAINVHMNVFRKTMIWIIALISLPIRVLTALQRERQLEEQICEMQNELDNLMWDMKALEDKFYVAVNERKVLELMLTEVEDESDRAFSKIEFLENQLQNLKRENLQLKEILLKGKGSYKDNGKKIKHLEYSDDHGVSYGGQSWKSSYPQNEIVFKELTIKEAAVEGETKGREESLSFFQAGSKSNPSIDSSTLEATNQEARQILKRRREAALSQSLFSALLSLLVGLIIWEAEDNCLPLVVALLIVVGMSLKSVVEFFSTIENKPASDAIALLSFNWFILGTITCPTLPIIARLLAPSIASFLSKTMSWLGI